VFKVLVLGVIRQEAIEYLQEFSELVILPDPVKKGDFIEHIKDADAILHKVAHIQRDVLQHQTQLKIISRHGVGLDLLDLPYLKELNIPVATSLEANSTSVAEFTMALVLSVLKNINHGEKMVKEEKGWQRERLIGSELSGLTAGVIGYGRIGSRLAGYFKAFCKNVLVYSLSPPFDPSKCPYESVDLDQLLRRADIVSLNCPLTPESKAFINSDKLKLFKRNAVLVNTARGALVDSKDLAQALRKGWLKAAAFDAFVSEPPDFSDELFTLDNFLATPHLASMTHDAQINMGMTAAREIRRVLMDNLPPTNNVLEDLDF
jgi:D-3-phosphoglycerate dehydrogenase